jgi:hypothetical protein
MLQRNCNYSCSAVLFMDLLLILAVVLQTCAIVALLGPEKNVLGLHHVKQAYL